MDMYAGLKREFRDRGREHVDKIPLQMFSEQMPAAGLAEFTRAAGRLVVDADVLFPAVILKDSGFHL